jgi:hypothetical protein
MKSTRFLFFVCLIFTAPACFATWTWRNPSPSGNDLLAVAYSTDFNIFTAVDRDGCIFTSPDGVTWMEPLIGNGTVALTGVAAGGGVIVAVGGDASANAVIYSSLDGGMSWQTNLSGNSGTFFLNAVAFGNNTFVAVGVSGTVATSPDGVVWKSEGTLLGPNAINGIAYGADPGDFVAAGNNGVVYYSSDGVTWNEATSNTGNQLNAVTYGLGTPGSQGLSGYFVIVGNSVFITSFEPQLVGEYKVYDSEDSARGVTYDGVDNKFVTEGNETTPGMLVSLDNGMTWNTANSKVQPPSGNAIAYGNGKFVAVGNGGFTATSIDSSNWVVNATSRQTVALTSGVYGPNLFVAGGGTIGNVAGSIYTSPDGNTWTPDLSSSAVKALNGTIPGGFIYANNQFVGVATDFGANGITAPTVGIALLSSDGINWTTNGITSSTHNTLTGIASGTVHGATVYVAVGTQGSTFDSTDLGAHWAYHPLGGMLVPNLTGVIFANSKFVAVGGGGISAVSTNGINWTTNNYSTLNTNLNAVTFGNGQFVAVGGQNNNYGVIFTSPDGLNWTQQFKHATGITYQALNSVNFANGAFVACGGGGAIYISRDGNTWFPDNSGTLNNLTCALFGDGQYMVLGSTGTILASSVLKLPLSLQKHFVHNSGSGTSFDITGTAGQSVIVEGSTDLHHWSVLGITNLPQGGTVNFTDPDTLSTIKFYRTPYLP